MSLRISIILSFFLSSLLCASPLKMDISSSSAVLMNAQNGRILFDKKKDLPGYPASITKIATTLYCLETQEEHLQERVKASYEALRIFDTKKQKEKNPAYLLESDGTGISLKVGEQLSLSSLLYAVMLASANDAANVVAEYSAGSIPKFIEGLNEYIQSLGCQNTHFLSPHGLHHHQHKTSPHDMAIITAEAMKNPQFRSIIATQKYLIPKTNKSDPREMSSSNRLIRKGNAHYYPYAIGGKTGYTEAAQSTLVAVAEKEGRQLIAVLMGSSKNERFKDAKKLFEAAFAEAPINQKIFKKTKTFSAKVEGADKLLSAEMKNDLVVEYYPAEEPIFKAYLQWDRLELPIQKGDQVGELWLVTQQNEVVKKEPIYAQEKLGKTFFFAVKDFFDHLFSKEKKKNPT